MDLVFNTFAFEAYSSRKSCTMTSQDSWMFRASAAILGIACTVRNHHFHPPICSKIAQELRYIDWVATTPLYCIRIGASQDAMVLASSTGGSDHDRDGIHREATDNKYVFAASMLPYIYILYEIRGIQKLFDGKGKQNASRLATSSPSVGRCIPSRFTCPTLRNIYCPSRISSTRRFIRSPYKNNLSLNAGVAVESHVGRTYNL
jgi:hypothetical protein